MKKNVGKCPAQGELIQDCMEYMHRVGARIIPMGIRTDGYHQCAKSVA